MLSSGGGPDPRPTAAGGHWRLCEQLSKSAGWCNDTTLRGMLLREHARRSHAAACGWCTRVHAPQSMECVWGMSFLCGLVGGFPCQTVVDSCLSCNSGGTVVQRGLTHAMQQCCGSRSLDDMPSGGRGVCGSSCWVCVQSGCWASHLQWPVRGPCCCLTATMGHTHMHTPALVQHPRP